MDQAAEFELLVLKASGQELADNIKWSSARLLCIAGDFTKYDGHAVQQINRNIELIRYLRFGEEFLPLELVNAVQATSAVDEKPLVVAGKPKPKHDHKSITEQLAQADQSLPDIFDAVKTTCIRFGDEVQCKTLKFYVAFKRLKNFASVEIRTNVKVIYVFAKVDPATVELVEEFTRDVTICQLYRRIGRLR